MSSRGSRCRHLLALPPAHFLHCTQYRKVEEPPHGRSGLAHSPGSLAVSCSDGSGTTRVLSRADSNLCSCNTAQPKSAAVTATPNAGSNSSRVMMARLEFPCEQRPARGVRGDKKLWDGPMGRSAGWAESTASGGCPGDRLAKGTARYVGYAACVAGLAKQRWAC
jgi:hypothetical protein